MRRTSIPIPQRKPADGENSLYGGPVTWRTLTAKMPFRKPYDSTTTAPIWTRNACNTVQQLEWGGQYSSENKAWASQIYIPPDKLHNLSFVVPTRSAVLDGVVDQYRTAYQALGLFGPDQCEPSSFEELDYEGKVLVLSPDTLKESYWNARAQLWYAHDGFGCSPKAIGRSVRCTCLGDGEMTRWNRTDFIGALKDEFLPEWAKEKLMELKGQEQNNDSPAMGGMTMK